MKVDIRIVNLDKRIILAEKAGDYRLFNKLRRERASTMGGIARQTKRSGDGAAGRIKIIDEWDMLRPRPGDLFAELLEQYEIIRKIAEKTGFSPRYIREVIATTRIEPLTPME